MLDAYIIDRIRREQERQQQIDRRLPLHIERPPFDLPEEVSEPRDDRPESGSDHGPDRGTVVIDYNV